MKLPKTKPAAGRPTTQRVAAINAAIVEATLDAFANDGSEFVIDQVAARAGVSKQAIYRRWDTKLDLLFHAIDQLLADRLNSALEDLPDDPIAALHLMAWRLFDRDHGRDHRIGIFLQAMALRDEGLQQRLQGWGEAFGAPYRRLLQKRATAAGTSLDHVDIEVDILLDLLRGATAELAITGLAQATDKRRVFDARWQAFARMMG